MENEYKEIKLDLINEDYDEDFFFDAYNFISCFSKRTFKKIKGNKTIIYEYADIEFEDEIKGVIKIKDNEYPIYRLGSVPALMHKPFRYVLLNHSNCEYLCIYKQRKIVSLFFKLFQYTFFFLIITILTLVMLHILQLVLS